MVYRRQKGYRRFSSITELSVFSCIRPTNYRFDQLSAPVSDQIPPLDYCGEVDGINVPIPHFGCVIEIVQFKEIQEKQESSDIKFVVKPQTRYEGKVGEQMTMFVFDYSGSPLEFKAFADPKEIFAV